MGVVGWALRAFNGLELAASNTCESGASMCLPSICFMAYSSVGAGLTTRRLLRYRTTRKTQIKAAMTPSATPTPIPACAPVERPDDDDGAVGLDDDGLTVAV
jgi:hypothetical protein